MVCKICQEKAKKLFNTKVLYKYNIQYYKCTNCGFIQTEKVFWLKEAYESAITNLDIGYATRNVSLSEIISTIIRRSFKKNKKFLDFGGGYGLFVRLMRDKGFNYFRQDLFCKNLFAEHFDIENLDNKKEFELITAFELYEHLDNPVEQTAQFFQLGDSILFSTELVPSEHLNKVEDWRYFIPETGQHIALFTKQSLEILAEKFDATLYSNSKNLHLITKKKLSYNSVKWTSLFYEIYNNLFSRHFGNKKSLLMPDYHFVQEKLNQGQLLEK